MNTRGGETDRTLANIRRRRKRLAAQNRPPESETIDDRLAVFQEQRAEEARIQADDLAALLATTAGRLFVRDHAGALDAEAARPAVERALAPWRAARPYIAQTPQAKGPPDDGSRPLPDDDAPPEQPDEEPPKEPDEDEEEPEPKECDALRKDLEWAESLRERFREAQIETQREINTLKQETEDHRKEINTVRAKMVEDTIKAVSDVIGRRNRRKNDQGKGGGASASPEDLFALQRELEKGRSDSLTDAANRLWELYKMINDKEALIDEKYRTMKNLQKAEKDQTEKILKVEDRMRIVGCD